SGRRVQLDFDINRTTPANYFRVRVEATDRDRVEKSSAGTWLNFVPTVQVFCQPSKQGNKFLLSVETLGTCGPLTYKWDTGATTPTLEVPALKEGVIADVTVK